jgi:hypothetical protein
MSERDIEKARELLRTLSAHSGDGLCCCDECANAIGAALAEARTDVWREVLALIVDLPIDTADLEFDSKYALRLGITDQHEAMAVALLRILRAAEAGAKPKEPG